VTASAADLPPARVGVRADLREPDAWYWRLPAVAQLRDDGMALAPATVLVGENGTGKSTLIEAVAHALRSSLTAQVKHWGPEPSAEDARLWLQLALTGARPRPQGGVWAAGEGFLALLESRTTERGLWILDEPESALSFRSSLRLLALLHGIANTGSQVLLATHSPLLAALPGATVYELDGAGFTEREWPELDLVRDWQAFCDDPRRLLHHLLDD
jgi:predicted ATPase